jgi:hypothetical protein
MQSYIILGCLLFVTTFLGILLAKKPRVNPPKMVQQLEIFFQVCVQTNSFANFPKINAYVSRNGLLSFLEKIKKIGADTDSPTEALKALEVSEPEMDIVQAIVFTTIKAACLGLVSKSNQKLDFERAFNHILERIEAEHYWSVVEDSMAEFVIECDDATVKRTFFEQKMIELVTPSK